MQEIELALEWLCGVSTFMYVGTFWLPVIVGPTLQYMYMYHINFKNFVKIEELQSPMVKLTHNRIRHFCKSALHPS